MRVLTRLEKEVFNAAYSSISRVASVQADSIVSIRAGGEPLPSVYIDLYHAFGSIEAIASLFCPMNEQKAKQWLFDYCFGNRVQPRDFQISGLISVDVKKSPPVTYTYQHED